MLDERKSEAADAPPDGTTQRVTSNNSKISDKTVTVFFTTTTSSSLPWRFEPVQDHVKLKLGQEALVFFRATNLSKEDIVGRALFNVTPDKAGLYFKKVQCFCFTQELLKAGQTVEMPVDFFVDPVVVVLVLGVCDRLPVAVEERPGNGTSPEPDLVDSQSRSDNLGEVELRHHV